MVNLEQVKAAAQTAGALTLEMRRHGLSRITDKSSTIDLVTEADLAAEQSLRRSLAAIDPAIEFWGEESNEPPHGERFWVVDPIDGTTNYANGLAPYAVNVGLMAGGEPVLGVTLELPAGRLYWAEQGKGAFVQEFAGEQPVGEPVRLAVNRVASLNAALLTTGFPYHRAEHTDNNLGEFAYFFGLAQGVRCMGSAAMDMVHVAAGMFAAYWEAWLKPWDIVAGVVIVREAGGVVTDYAGKPWRLHSKGLIAHNGQPALHQAMVEGIRAVRGGLPARLFEL